MDSTLDETCAVYLVQLLPVAAGLHFCGWDCVLEADMDSVVPEEVVKEPGVTLLGLIMRMQ